MRQSAQCPWTELSWLLQQPSPCRPSRSRSSTTFARARAALAIIETYDQDRVDRLIGPSRGRSRTARVPPAGGDGNRGVRPRRLRQPHEQADEDPRRPSRRCAALGGHHRGGPEKGSSSTASRSASSAASFRRRTPTSPAGNAIYAIKARDVVVFSPHPRSKHTTFETVRPHARGARGGGCSGRHPAVHHAAESRGLAGDHAPLRPRHRHRRTGTGPRGLQLGNARVRRGRGQRDRVRRRDRRPPGDGPQLHAVEDVGLRLGLLGGWERPGAGGRIARCSSAPGGGRLSRDVGAARGAPGGDVGRRGTPPARHRRVSPQALARAAGFDIPRTAGSSWSRATDRRRQAVLQGEAHDADGDPPYEGASRTASSSPSSSTRSAARATRAASPRPTMRTSTTSHGTCPSRASWCASRTRRRTPDRSRTGCR